jgi:hypothetical protein
VVQPKNDIEFQLRDSTNPFGEQIDYKKGRFREFQCDADVVFCKIVVARSRTGANYNDTVFFGFGFRRCNYQNK